MNIVIFFLITILRLFFVLFSNLRVGSFGSMNNGIYISVFYDLAETKTDKLKLNLLVTIFTNIFLKALKLSIF